MALTVDINAGLATVTIDHPPSNLVDGVFIIELMQLLDRLESDPDCRVMLFLSADPDFFLMHGDIEQILSMPATEYVPVTEPNVAAAVFDRISRSHLVSIGRLDGVARGGGCEFLSALDIRMASPLAVIGQPEVAMGIVPGAGGTARWPRLVGRGRALEILLSGRDVGADEAFAIGWLDLLRPADSLADDCLRLARRIARMPAGSLAAIKRVVDISLTPISDALVSESAALAERFAAGEHRKPMRAFLAAGGQTRDPELNEMERLTLVMLEEPPPPS